MIRQILPNRALRFLTAAFFGIAALFFNVSCSVAESKNAAAINKPAVNSTSGATIPIDSGGPADTVRVFYKDLREKKFREAIFLTNLRPAIEGLTDTELKDFALDFEAIAGQVPAELQINGEIISGDNATVTANLPDPDDETKITPQQIKLRREKGIWVILTVDDAAEKRIKEEGKQYFYNLRIETHQDEARKMMERIAKAEIAYSAQNDGNCGDIATLVSTGLLPPDIQTSASTGYNYRVSLTNGNKRYFANATPAEYGKSGKLSFVLEIDDKGLPHVNGKDNGGKVIKN